MAAVPFYHPIIPTVIPIPDGFYIGRVVRVQGHAPAKAKSFAMNLQCGPNTDINREVALHFSPQFKDKTIKRNSIANSKWGAEETTGGMPINRGHDFEILIYCTETCMKIAINGNHFCDFNHRIAALKISHIAVDGDVEILMIGFEDTRSKAKSRLMSAQGIPAKGAAVNGGGTAQPAAAEKMPQEQHGYPPSPNFALPTPAGAPFPGPAPQPMTAQDQGPPQPQTGGVVGAAATAASGAAGAAAGVVVGAIIGAATENVMNLQESPFSSDASPRTVKETVQTAEVHEPKRMSIGSRTSVVELEKINNDIANRDSAIRRNDQQEIKKMPVLDSDNKSVDESMMKGGPYDLSIKKSEDSEHIESVLYSGSSVSEATEESESSENS